MNLLMCLCLIPVACILVLLGIFVWNKPILLIHGQILLVCTMRFIYTETPVPSAIRYLTDVITLVLFLQTFLQLRRRVDELDMGAPLTFCGLFLVSTIISFCLSGQSVISYLWGTRVLMRFFVFFIACAVFLRREDVERIIKLLFWLLPVNVLASSFQYFVQGYTFDFNSGLFGNEVGCNAEMNMYLVQLVIFAFAMYLQNQFRIKHLLLVLGMALYIAALSELKVLFFEIPMVFLCMALLYKPSKKIVGIALAGGITIYFAMILFLILYPGWSDFFTYDSIMYYLKDGSYAGGETLNRFSSIQYVYQNLLTNLREKLFGVGLGNADTCSFFVSAYYEKYEHLKYTFFGNAHCLFENGMVGLICYLAVFVSSGVKAFKMMWNREISIGYAAMGCVTGAFALFYGIYNQALRTEVSYLYFFWLSVPFVMFKERNVENEA